MYALRDKSSKKLLTVEPDTEVKSDWGYDGRDERMMDYTTVYLRVYLCDVPQYYPAFVTPNKGMAHQLLKTGKWDSVQQIRLVGPKENFEIVKLQIKKAKHRKVPHENANPTSQS